MIRRPVKRKRCQRKPVFNVTYIIKGDLILADFARIEAAVATVVTAINGVAEAIRNPANDLADQAKADELAGVLEAAGIVLNGLIAEENAEDGVVVEPPVEEEPEA